MIASFHNHTRWSDGRTEVGAMYTYADRQGVDILGISDHFCIYPDGTSPSWSVQPARAPDYIAEVLSFRGRGKMDVRVGAEFDWFADHAAVLEPVVAGLDLDYRIGSVHHVDKMQFDSSPAFWREKTQDERDAVFVRYWSLVRGMAESTLFDIAAHLDLPKKFGFAPAVDMGPHINAALDAIKAAGMVVELNTAGFGRPCAEAYPSPPILAKCLSREIPVTLSSDGHLPAHILFEFERGLGCLRDAGFTSISRFRDREMWSESLGEALRSAR
jgi:histidinol-phosphatase (PHP family)